MNTKRTIGTIVLGCVVASLAVLVGLILALGLGPGLAVGFAAALVVLAAYITMVGPWQRRWGASDREVERAMPGDDILGPSAPSTTRAITIDATPAQVFPWLLQIGYGRGGWYSYDWIDNEGEPSLRRIESDLQRLAVGDRIEMMPGIGPVVREVEPDHHLVAASEVDSWCLLVEPSDDSRRTRLISRWRQRWPMTPATYVWIALADPGAFVMEQRMLRTIRALAANQAVEGASR